MKARKIFVVDIECTCWEKGKQPLREIQEIIEIGFCEVDMLSMKIGKPRSLYVRPANSSVSEYCTDLTGITQETADTMGSSFKEAADILVSDYGTKYAGMASWGTFDREVFEKCCAMYCVEYPFSNRHVDLKYLFSMWRGAANMCGLETAVKKMGIKFEGRQHSGKDDAYNTAKVLVGMLRSFRTARDIMERLPVLMHNGICVQ